MRETIAAGLERAERALDRASALWRERGARGREVLREYRRAISGARRERVNALRLLSALPEAV
jgi:hypothetical protein